MKREERLKRLGNMCHDSTTQAELAALKIELVGPETRKSLDRHAKEMTADATAITETLAELERYRTALPNPGRLELLADWFDMKFPNDPMPEVQADLRKWAMGIREALADEEVKSSETPTI